MGDFKLKTAKDYVVPEHLRMNALKKRNQLLKLEELVSVMTGKLSVLLID